MGRKGIEVVASELEREQLLSMSRSRSLPHSLVRRAKIVLMAADGRTTPLPQANAYAMVRRRALAAGIDTRIGNHTFRATGITAYLKNGGTLENAATMANHASTRTTQLYDRRRDDISLDEVERIHV